MYFITSHSYSRPFALELKSLYSVLFCSVLFQSILFYPIPFSKTFIYSYTFVHLPTYLLIKDYFTYLPTLRSTSTTLPYFKNDIRTLAPDYLPQNFES